MIDLTLFFHRTAQPKPSPEGRATKMKLPHPAVAAGTAALLLSAPALRCTRPAASAGVAAFSVAPVAPPRCRAPPPGLRRRPPFAARIAPLRAAAGSAQDFDQTQYTDAAWAALAALPGVADAYGATSIDAPMLLAVLLDPTRYQAGAAA